MFIVYNLFVSASGGGTFFLFMGSGGWLESLEGVEEFWCIIKDVLIS